MSFREYMHVERFGTEAVDGIELGKVYVFPKLDGTNASVWWHDGRTRAGSRTRELDTVNFQQDNAGFAAAVYKIGSEFANIHGFLHANPHIRLYGEWLVPHTFKDYRPEVWRKFYIFDVYNNETDQYLSYDVYAPLLEAHALTYIPPLAIVKNGDYDTFLKYVLENKYLCPDNGTPGEGVVIKNYDYYNKFGNQVWAKIIRQEFKDEHNRVMGAPDINAGLMNEERILDIVDMQHLVDKTHAKICNEKGGWTSKNIPELLNRVYYDIVKEELWDALKETKVDRINFKTLKALTIQRIKQTKPEIF